MSRLLIETRGVADWQSRLADPAKQWRDGYSAKQTAEAWEAAAATRSGLPAPLADLLAPAYGDPVLALAVAEHTVPLAGQGHDPQCDVWALVTTDAGLVSVAVEAKAAESFGPGNQALRAWLTAGTSAGSPANRQERWRCIEALLPPLGPGGYDDVPYQLLQRTAAAVIEARRLRLRHAALVVQAFGAPDKSFTAYAALSRALALPAARGRMHLTQAGVVTLGVGWADC